MQADISMNSEEFNMHPPDSRVHIAALASRADLNGKEARVLEWFADKQRFAVVVRGHKPLLVRAANLTRCPDATARLDEDALAAVLGTLATWNDAARAMGVQRSWRAAIQAGAWPRFARAETPPHWKQRKRFGTEWKERGPFARPLKWASPCAEPSWMCALHGMRGVERVPRLLRWLDDFDAAWPGVAVTRWPGAARRLAWAQGCGDKILMHELRGCILREFPPGSGTVNHNSYRDGGQFGDANAVAPACRFTMPADAALFMALLPLGFGEVASDGSFVRPFDGFEVALAPWEPEAPYGAVPLSAEELSARIAHATPELRESISRLDRHHGCDPSTLVSVARPQRAIDDDDPAFMGQLLLCCDTASDQFGKLLIAHYVPGLGPHPLHEGPVALYRWTNLCMSGLLELITEAASETVSEAPELDSASHGERAGVGGRGKWDLTWQTKFGTVQKVVFRLELRARAVPVV